MSEMVERVERAIDLAIGKWHPGSLKRVHQVAALAAIAAMREPTQEMLVGIDRNKVHTPLFNEDGSVVTDENLAYCWQTMIDAALAKVPA